MLISLEVFHVGVRYANFLVPCNFDQRSNAAA
jgi:hypothetical protein